MIGFKKVFLGEKSYSAFPSSRYNSPHGGRISALEKNIFRYRACEISLFLFYAEDLKRFMIDNVYHLISEKDQVRPHRDAKEEKLLSLLKGVVSTAESDGRMTAEESIEIYNLIEDKIDDGKKLRKAFAFAVKIGLCSEVAAKEMRQLIDYRNDIAHRTHKVVADVSNHSIVKDLDENYILYKGQALERIRILREELAKNSRVLPSMVVSFDSLVFESAEKFYVNELRRLDNVIVSQVASEKLNFAKLSDELDWAYSLLQPKESPRHPENFLPPVWVGTEDLNYSNRLSKKGAALCSRFFANGVSDIAIAYIMGLTLRSVERRRKAWGLRESARNK